MSEIIQAFFFGTSFGESIDGKPHGLIGFAIPELGVIYRSRHRGTTYECQYAGLLALLKFIDLNKKQFDETEFQVLSDSTLVVYQISHRRLITKELTSLYNAALNYKRKVNYRVSWVPRQENIAIIGINQSPPFRSDLELNLDIDSPDGIHFFGS